MNTIQNLVVWGGVTDGNSLSHCFRSFHTTAHKLGIRSVWTDDMADARALLVPGVTVIAADLWGDHIGPAVPGVDYVLHNFSGDHELCMTAEPEHLLRLQVYTSDAFGEEWAPYRLYNREGRILFQPWGCSLLSEEFLDPVFRPLSREAAFVGAVWSDQHLQLRCYANLSDEEMIGTVRDARLAPAFSGQWQVDHDYIPCRALKNPSYGTLGLSNVPAVQELLGGWHPTAGTVPELVDSALALKRSEYLGLVREQQRIVANYSYRNALEAIDRALEEGR